MTIAERVKKAAEELGEDLPEAHIIVVAIEGGIVSLFAKSNIVNEQLDAIAALHYVADQTVAQASRRVTRGLRKARASSVGG